MEARAREKKNEYESAKGWSPSQKERMRGMCVRGTERVSALGGGSERQRWSEEWDECWRMDYRGSEIGEEESRMVVRCETTGS